MTLEEYMESSGSVVSAKGKTAQESKQLKSTIDTNRKYLTTKHGDIVEQALIKGENVPIEVLNDYPGLKKIYY